MSISSVLLGRREYSEGRFKAIYSRAMNHPGCSGRRVGDGDAEWLNFDSVAQAAEYTGVNGPIISTVVRCALRATCVTA